MIQTYTNEKVILNATDCVPFRSCILLLTQSVALKGSYNFILHEHIDRALPPNLLHQDYEISLWQTLGEQCPTQV